MGNTTQIKVINGNQTHRKHKNKTGKKLIDTEKKRKRQIPNMETKQEAVEHRSHKHTNITKKRGVN